MQQRHSARSRQALDEPSFSSVFFARREKGTTAERGGVHLELSRPGMVHYCSNRERRLFVRVNTHDVAHVKHDKPILCGSTYFKKRSRTLCILDKHRSRYKLTAEKTSVTSVAAKGQNDEALSLSLSLCVCVRERVFFSILDVCVCVGGSGGGGASSNERSKPVTHEKDVMP